MSSIIDILPPELMTEVFMFVGNHRSITRSLSRVSRRFYHFVTRNPELDQHLCDNNLWNGRTGNLLEPTCRGDIQTGIIKNPFDRTFGKIVSRWLPGYTSLRALFIGWFMMDDQNLSTLFGAIKRNTTIYSLELSRVEMLSDMVSLASSIKEVLMHNTTIRSLSLELCGMEDESMKQLADGLANNTTLKWFSMTRNQFFSLKGMEYLCAVLEHNTTLHSLNLGYNGNRIDEVSLRLLLDTMTRNRGIRNLFMETISFTHNVPEFVRMLKMNTILKKLYLLDTGLESMSVMPVLTDALKKEIPEMSDTIICCRIYLYTSNRGRMRPSKLNEVATKRGLKFVPY